MQTQQARLLSAWRSSHHCHYSGRFHWFQRRPIDSRDLCCRSGSLHPSGQSDRCGQSDARYGFERLGEAECTRQANGRDRGIGRC